MSDVIRVNFARPMPVFALPDDVLLPHAIKALHVFEPRYRQMIDESLDSNGQICMAVLETDNGIDARKPRPAVRPVVCVGQVVRHETLPDGRHNILLHGICRARIERLIEPSGERLYRLAVLRPLERMDADPPPLEDVRFELQSMLECPYLKHLRCIDTVMDWIRRDEISTHALLELIGFAIVRDTDIRYQLLAEPDAECRADIIKRELDRLSRVVGAASRQSHKRWPKGASWN